MMLSTFQSGLTVPYRTFFLRFGSARARHYRARAEHTPCTVRYGLFCERDMAIRFGSIKCTVRFDKCTVRLVLGGILRKSCAAESGPIKMSEQFQLQPARLPSTGIAAVHSTPSRLWGVYKTVSPSSESKDT